ncbi:dephospho-CoA kinase [Bacillus coahuilensis p1.1.43]|uniref:Dephospho-CoA kinase n=1 Tax=Bacillus coahuilensis p1.1.43 TaxID=1150625 RepID=A0A147K6N3_9BACI|nr:dephospho-CoA kinase [Bacillus coahuilensis]KUP05569.1 dephospho-CoA kinase [Bacillus coahuilensis p1.1.43]
MAKIIGLTGGIASGKSTVSTMLLQKGFKVIDADIAARKVVEPGEEAYLQIIEEFGQQIIWPSGELNRERLGEVIFNNEEKRLMLNSIVHPAVRKEMIKEKEEALEIGRKTIFMDIPLLFESKLTWMVDKVILVYVERDEQIKRLMRRNEYSEEMALSRIQSQMPLEEKVALSDIIINNNKTFKETEDQVDSIIEKWELKP